MDIALLIFPRLTALDAIGPYEVLQRLPGARVKFVAAERGVYRTEQNMLGLIADFATSEVTSADILVVPGGIGTRPLVEDEADPRVDPRDRRGQHVDHVGVHGLAAARRGRTAARERRRPRTGPRSTC